MNNIIRNFAGIKVICHLLLTAIWLYWGICVHPLTFGWIGWTILIGGGFTYLIVGAICLHEESAVRGIAKTTTKGLIGVGGVGAGAAVGSIFGPLGTLAGAVIGGIVTYHNNKQIDKGVDAVIDIWNYEVDGGRIVNFKCPICGNEWVETELYGEIEH